MSDNEPDGLREFLTKIQEYVDEIVIDLEKSIVKNNLAAGRRARSKLRKIKKTASKLINELIILEKNKRK